MSILDRMTGKFEKEKDVPSDNELENILSLQEKVNSGDNQIQAEQIKKDKEDSKGKHQKVLEQLLTDFYMRAKMAGYKKARVMGTKKDKMFMMTMINSGLTVMVVVLIVLTNFLL